MVSRIKVSLVVEVATTSLLAIGAVWPIAELSCNGDGACQGLNCELNYFSLFEFKTLAQEDNPILLTFRCCGHQQLVSPHI
jgi:hypothetical protein